MVAGDVKQRSGGVGSQTDKGSVTGAQGNELGTAGMIAKHRGGRTELLRQGKKRGGDLIHVAHGLAWRRLGLPVDGEAGRDQNEAGQPGNGAHGDTLGNEGRLSLRQ